MSNEPLFAIFQHKGLKLVALVLATLSWMGIQEITSFEQRFRDIPVEIQHDAGMSVKDFNPQTMDVRLRGTRADILALDELDMRIEIDLRGQPFEEDLLIEITDKHIIYPGAARLVDIDPTAVHLRMDQTISQRAKVVTETRDALQEGYTLESITTDPEWVTLRGSRQLVGAIERVLTEPIDLGGKVQSFESRVPLVPPSPNWPARMEPQSVLVRVDIAESFVQRVIEGVPLHVMRNPGDFTALELSNESVTVTLKGNPDVVEKLGISDLQAYAKAGELKNGEAVKRRVLIDIPTRVRLVSVEPSQISIRQILPKPQEIPPEPVVEQAPPENPPEPVIEETPPAQDTPPNE